MGSKASCNSRQTSSYGKDKVQSLLTILSKLSGVKGLSNTEVMGNLSETTEKGRIETDTVGMTQIDITLKECLEMRGTFVMKDKDL